MIDPAIIEIAQQTLTKLQYDCWRMNVHGYSQRTIAYQVDRSRTHVVDTTDAAWRALRAHGVYCTPDGQPYLKETA